MTSSRKLKKRRQEMNGWPDTFSGRTKRQDFSAGWECQEKPNHVTIKWYSIEHPKHSWRKW